MAYVHIAHDCRVGNQTIIASFAGLAGHVHLGDWAIVGGQSGLHQFVKYRRARDVRLPSHVSKDVPPYMMVDGNPLAVRGFNAEGLRRRGFGRRAHRRGQADAQAALPRGPHLRGGAQPDRRARRRASPRPRADVQLMTAFLADATRGHRTLIASFPAR